MEPEAFIKKFNIKNTWTQFIIKWSRGSSTMVLPASSSSPLLWGSSPEATLPAMCCSACWPLLHKDPGCRALKGQNSKNTWATQKKVFSWFSSFWHHEAKLAWGPQTWWTHPTLIAVINRNHGEIEMHRSSLKYAEILFSGYPIIKVSHSKSKFGSWDRACECMHGGPAQ